MRKTRITYLLGGLALALLLLVGVGWLFSERLLDGFARPLLVRVAAERLDARVSLERIDLDPSGLRLTNLSLQRPGEFSIELPGIEADFTLASLLRRRLSALRLLSPSVELTAPTEPRPPAPRAPPPSHPPLEIDRLLISDGILTLNAAGRSYLLSELHADAQGTAQSHFQARGRFGAGEGIALAVRGGANWDGAIALSLDQLRWGERDLLAAPLDLTLGETTSAGGALRLERFDDTDLANIAAALGRPPLLPEGWRFEVLGADVSLRLGEAGLALAFGAQGARAWNETLEVPLRGLRLELNRGEAGWAGAGRFRLGDAIAGRLQGLWGEAGAAGGLNLDIPSPTAGEDPAVLYAEASAPGGVWQGELRAERLGDGHLRQLLAALGVAEGLPAALRGELDGLRVQGRLEPQGPAALVQANRGEWRSDSLVIPFADLSIDLLRRQQAWQAEGRVRLADSAPTRLRAEYAEGRAEGRLSLELPDPALLQKRLLGAEQLKLAGAATLQAAGTWTQGELALQGSLQGKRRPGRTGDYQLDLAPLALAVDARVKGGRTRLELRATAKGRPLLRAAGSPDRLAFEAGPLNWGELGLIAGPGLLPAAVREAEALRGKGLLTLSGEGRWQLEAELDADRVALAQGSFSSLRLEGRAAPAADGVGFSVPAFSAAAEMAGLQASRIFGRGEGLLGKEGFEVSLENIAAEGLEYLSADGMAGLSGGHLQGRVSLSGSLDGQRLELAADTGLGAGEVLYGAFYADISALQGRLALKGTYQPQAGELVAESFTFSAARIGALQGRGRHGPQGAQLEAAWALDQFDGPAAPYLRALLTAAAPGLKELRLRGALAGDLELRHTTEQWRARGEIRPAALGFALPGSPLEAQGCSGLIPFDLAGGASAMATGDAGGRLGALGCESLQAGPAALRRQPLEILVRPNRFAIRTPVVFNVAGGLLEIADAEIAMAGEGPEATARIRIADVDLERLTADLGAVPMTGAVSADLGQIRYAGGELETGGEAAISAFGGEIRIRDIRFREPFSSYPILQGDVDFTGIDLQQLTHTFEFGEMNGVVDGYVRGLRLFGKTPSHFTARLETRDQGRRNISVKALNNLSILSQGGLSAALSRGIYRFIDFYRYRRIGIVCSLENDVFRLQGTARPGSDRYLVYGALLPPRIDIVAPARSISFKEMVKRLGRIDRTGGK
ncbi:hypothetical protein DESUT3_30440 [Desulfuromonas versatilis]|uniref:AsmA-like C-terminal domain-containing protein n=1 Tax=Desulfuromonas versatilis TaxID=2802975 RepID=A0ABM8HYW0_9BACT|nr:hypothetical protein [Desulfuromonas versatilis]BCR05975.1 hypothetical protein DESUT3_30440 [Desulfuromonas versatilis]